MIGAAEYEAREDFNRQKFMFQLSVYYSFSSDIRVHRGGRSLIAKSLCFNYQFTVLFETLPFPCNLSLHHLLFLVVCKINQKAKDGPKGFQVGGQGVFERVNCYKSSPIALCIVSNYGYG